jgi:hypothetical protein
MPSGAVNAHSASTIARSRYTTSGNLLRPAILPKRPIRFWLLRIARRATPQPPKTQKSTLAIIPFQFVTINCKLVSFPLSAVCAQAYTSAKWDMKAQQSGTNCLVC